VRVVGPGEHAHVHHSPVPAKGTDYAKALDLTRSQFHLKILSGLVTASGTAAILLVGAHEVSASRLTTGGLLVFLGYLAALFAPLDALVHAASAATQAAGGVHRIIELLQEPEDVVDAPGATPLVLNGPPSIHFQDVTFAYRDSDPALVAIDLLIPAGATVALVGASGAGKSTLAALILRVADPSHGRVLIDGADARALTLRSLREQVAILLQDTYLFPVPVRENIAYGRPDATTEQIEAAARAAGAHEFVARLPDGYDTMVGPRGATLSGGERQRIGIARALLKDAPILILDEPTSALDAETEANLLSALELLRRGRTTLIISHRLSTIWNADRILVLERGSVVEEGTHAELLARGGPYARMHEVQRYGMTEDRQ
jgi:ATP-binding cassette, subfamily B, bacterial